MLTAGCLSHFMGAIYKAHIRLYPEFSADIPKAHAFGGNKIFRYDQGKVRIKGALRKKEE